MCLSSLANSLAELTNRRLLESINLGLDTGVCGTTSKIALLERPNIGISLLANLTVLAKELKKKIPKELFQAVTVCPTLYSLCNRPPCK
jgi:hypothetical protein